MKLDLAFELPFARDEVWPAFRDVELLVGCLPGASLRSRPDERPLLFDFAVKLGPISTRFSGEGALCYADFAGVLSGAGTDRATASRVKGEAAFRLEEIAVGTRVRIDVDFALSGVLAQFGRSGIVKEVAGGITQRFGENLRGRIAGGTAPGTSASSGVQAGTLDAGKLVWDMVKRRFGPAGGSGDASAG